MMTTKGEIADELLRKEELKEKVPCGECITTKFFDSTGEMVRSDVRIDVDKEFILRAASMPLKQ